MATQTTNYNLIKPAYSDPVDVAVLNDNADIIDETLAAKANLVSGKVPASELPSYVDDIIEGYYYNSNFYEDAGHTTLITGETGKIYLDLSTEDCYRWSGSVYVHISAAPVQSDWNENDSTSMAYIQNRTHYGEVRTELMNTSWDGDFSSATAPTVADNDYKEYSFYADGDKKSITTYLYRMSADNSTIDLTNLKGKIYVAQDGTAVINTIGTMTECVNSYIDWAIAQGYITEDQREMFLQLIQTTEITTVVNNVTIQDIGFYTDEEPEFAFYVLYVAEEGDYNLIPTLYPDAGASYTGGNTHLYQGIYAFVPYTGVVANPISISSIVKLDRKYLPSSLEEDIALLQLATSNLFYDITLSNIAGTSSGFTATSDKTGEEIVTAFNSGKTIRIASSSGLINMSGNVCNAFALSSTSAYLSIFGAVDGSMYHMTVTGTSVTAVAIGLVTSLSASSTDNEYPTAKCVYDIIGDVESALTELIGG